MNRPEFPTAGFYILVSELDNTMALGVLYTSMQLAQDQLESMSDPQNWKIERI
jgi:hypothetical protein